MRVCIRSGTEEIGGTRIRIEAQRNRTALHERNPLDECFPVKGRTTAYCTDFRRDNRVNIKHRRQDQCVSDRSADAQAADKHGTGRCFTPNNDWHPSSERSDAAMVLGHAASSHCAASGQARPARSARFR